MTRDVGENVLFDPPGFVQNPRTGRIKDVSVEDSGPVYLIEDRDEDSFVVGESSISDGLPEGPTPIKDLAEELGNELWGRSES